MSDMTACAFLRLPLGQIAENAPQKMAGQIAFVYFLQAGDFLKCFLSHAGFLGGNGNRNQAFFHQFF